MYQNVYEEAGAILPEDILDGSGLLGEKSVKIADLIDDVAKDSQRNSNKGLKAILGAQLKSQMQHKIDYAEQ